MKNFPLLSLLFLFLLSCQSEPSGQPKQAEQSADKNSPFDYAYRQRAYPYGQVKAAYYRTAMRQWQSLRHSAAQRNNPILDWQEAGPYNIGGRISALAVDPNNRDLIYVGAASGGIFKSMNGGQSWNPIFDDALSLSIGDVVLAPSNSNIVYVGTGEANPGGGSLAYDGVGMYRSDDGGQNWVHIGLENIGSIGQVAVHPQDPQTVLVAGMGHLFANGDERGLYRSQDGGSNWEKVLAVNDSTGFIEVAYDLAHPDTIYAASWERVRRPERRDYTGNGSRIWRSTDGGDSWQMLSVGNGLPAGELGRIGLAVAESQAGRVYATVVGLNNRIEGVYRSDNYGENWTSLPSADIDDVSYQWWFGKMFVDPSDADKYYVFSLDLWRSANGNPDWEQVSNNVHVDQHDLFIDPNDSDFLLLANDGGLYRSNNGAQSWTHINNLPINQFYRCEIDETKPDRLYGGVQDNGSLRTLGGNLDDWEKIFGGDGFVNLVDPSNPDNIYVEFQYGNLFRSINGGAQFTNATTGLAAGEPRNWNMPVIFDPTNPQTMYCGTNRLYRSTNGAASWSPISPPLANPSSGNLVYGTITAIAVSPINNNYILVGTDDAQVWRSLDGGNNWTLLSQNLPDRWVTSVAFDPQESNTVYVTFSGYRWDEYLPHVYRSTDAGDNWQDISAGLPEVPVNDLIIRPDDPTQLYLATDAGVYQSLDSGQNWELADAGLPKVPVNELDYHAPTRKLVAATYGRSLYQATLPPLVNVGDIELPNVSVKVFPNPFVEEVTIEIELEEAEWVRVELFDLEGRLVEVIYNGIMPKDLNNLVFKPKNPIAASLLSINSVSWRKNELLYRQ